VGHRNLYPWGECEAHLIGWWVSPCPAPARRAGAVRGPRQRACRPKGTRASGGRESPAPVPERPPASDNDHYGLRRPWMDRTIMLVIIDAGGRRRRLCCERVLAPPWMAGGPRGPAGMCYHVGNVRAMDGPPNVRRHGWRFGDHQRSARMWRGLCACASCRPWMAGEWPAPWMVLRSICPASSARRALTALKLDRPRAHLGRSTALLAGHGRPADLSRAMDGAFGVFQHRESGEVSTDYHVAST